LAAGIVNSVWRIVHNSWTCLLVEDADQSQLVDIYTWIYIANIMVGFIAPLAGAKRPLIPCSIHFGICFFVKCVVLTPTNSFLSYHTFKKSRQSRVDRPSKCWYDLTSMGRDYSS
jgi:hypothetical protein